MVDISQSSFIPKNKLPNRNRQKVGRRYNFFFFSLVIYGFFIATPIASAVVFIYEKYTGNVINQITYELDEAIKAFSESDLLTIERFNNRLFASGEVLANNFSVNNVVQFFLQNAPRTVAFKTFEIVANDDATLAVTAEVTSESFDYVLFYRDELLRNPNFISREITDLSYRGTEKTKSENQTSQTKNDSSNQESASKLSYQVSFLVPLAFFSQSDEEAEFSEEFDVEEAESVAEVVAEGTELEIDNEINI